MSSVTLTITDDDRASTGIVLTVDADPGDAVSTSLAEGANSTSVTVTATVNDGAPSSDVTVTLSLGGTAAKGTDYDDPGTLNTITISADQTSGSTTVSIDPTDDDIDEGTGETIVFDATASGGLTLNAATAVTDATLTITDDDTASTTISLSVTDTSIGEGETTATTQTVTATLSGTTTPRCRHGGDAGLVVGRHRHCGLDRRLHPHLRVAVAQDHHHPGRFAHRQHRQHVHRHPASTTPTRRSPRPSRSPARPARPPATRAKPATSSPSTRR